MEEIRFENPKKGLIPSIISSILTTASIFCCIMFGVMVKDHFELQATAENFEGLGSIGIILVGIIFMLISLICMMISIVFSLFTVLKGYFQGGLTFYNAKLGILASLQKMVDRDLVTLPKTF